MPHAVTFEEWRDASSLLTEEQVRALIDLLYRGEDDRFVIYGCLPEGIRGPRRDSLGGMHQKLLDGRHCIHLVPKNIRSRASRGGAIGGNRKVSDPKLAIGLVLAHELQHANQTLNHKPGSSFYGKPFQRYAAHACEREARQYADDNLGLVAGVLGISLPNGGFQTDNATELVDVIDCFLDLDEMPVADLILELKECGINNPENVRRCREKLQEYGVRVLSGSAS